MSESDAPWRGGQIAYAKVCGLAFSGYVAEVRSDTLVIGVAQPDGVDLTASKTNSAWRLRYVGCLTAVAHDRGRQVASITLDARSAFQFATINGGK